MSFASSQQSFLISSLSSIQFQFPKSNTISLLSLNNTILISSKHQPHDSKTSTRRRSYEQDLGRLAVVTLAAGILTLGSVDPASAAKSGGRVGGQAFRSSAPSAPRSSSPRINNSRTNIYINPRVAPPLGGYGYGYGYGGWGWSPFSFFAPGPGIAVGIGGGFDTLVFFLFLGAAAAVVRRFFGSREDDDGYY